MSQVFMKNVRVDNIECGTTKPGLDDFRRALGLPLVEDHAKDAQKYAMGGPIRPTGGPIRQKPITKNPCAEIMLSTCEFRTDEFKIADPNEPTFKQKLELIGARTQLSMSDEGYITGMFTKPGENMNTLSTSSGNIASTATVRNQSLEVDFDQAVWKIDLPGVEPKDVEVFTVKDRAYVQVQDRPKALEFILADGETVKDSTFALGVLSVTIDRPHKKVPVKVN